MCEHPRKVITMTAGNDFLAKSSRQPRESLPESVTNGILAAVMVWAQRADVVELVIMGEWKTWKGGINPGPYSVHWNENFKSHVKAVTLVQQMYKGFPV